MIRNIKLNIYLNKNKYQMDSLINKDNEEINALDKENNYEMQINKNKELENKNFLNINLKNSTIQIRGINTVLDSEQNKNKFLFNYGNKSDDEDNIKEQIDLCQIKGRKSINKLNNNEIDEIGNENIFNKYNTLDEVIDMWKYEKLLLENNILDYNCKYFLFF